MQDNKRLCDLKELVDEFVSQREWNKFHDAKNLSMALSIEANELMQELLWESTDTVKSALEKKREQIENEAADVLFALLALSNVCNINLSSAFMKKLAINQAKYPVDKCKGRSEKYTQYADIEKKGS